MPGTELLTEPVLEQEQEVEQTQRYTTLLRQSPSMAQVMEQLEMCSVSEAPLLIYGESGTGKEMVARSAWEQGLRRRRRLVVVNCAALAENLIESILFGHEKGAFTGAIAKHIGHFEKAHKATVFLDEVGKLPLPLQEKLLRVAENYPFYRVGGSEEIQVDVRLILATNRDLLVMVREGKFLEDLYYRLKVLLIKIPPLRDRPDDITTLAHNFLREFTNGDGVTFGSGSMNALLKHSWPGNVRELRSAVHHAAVFRNGVNVIEPCHLPEEILEPELQQRVDPLMEKPTAVKATTKTSLVEKTLAGFPEVVKIPDVERELIRRALVRNEGNQAKSSRDLGISRATLRKRVEKHKITFATNINVT
ncbi:MAG: sigma-54 dependent transcriptional regulator [bacterium]|nr:sigma-54 dependent transcriptional regulator [bacterium]